MKKRFVLPKKTTLPGGFVIRVVEGPMAEGDAEWDYDSSGSGVIRLRSGMTLKQQKYHYSHEMNHALIDYHHLLIQEGAEP